jgi:hypothetical protein
VTTTQFGADHEDLIQRLGITLLDLVPEEGWRRVDLFSAMAGTARELVLTVIMNDGTRPEIQPPPQLNEILAELRTLLYEPGRGAWLSARISMNPPGAIFYNYNFDHEPGLTPPMTPAAYAEELKAFPREPEHVPGWLGDRVATANGGEQK